MGKKQNSDAEPAGRDWRRGLRYTLYSLGALGLILAGLLVYSRVDQFLSEDERFRLAAPSPETGESPALRIEGAAHASRSKITNAFAPDFGRSLYLLPMKERRQSLLSIDWVKDASVSRLWPDRLEVRIVERDPVAFVQLTSSGASPSETALIDADGVILDMPARSQFNLPVLTGLARDQKLNLRRERVAVALRLLREVNGLAGQLSEVDVSDPDNVRVVQTAEGRAVMLHLGNRNFLPRMQNFLSHYSEIRRRLPNATNFDLRLDDRITALGEGGKGG